MLERYAKALREVVPAACREAAALGAEVVTPDHLLLALAQIEGPARILDDLGLTPDELHEALEAADAEALVRFGISLEAVREQIEESFGNEAWRDGASVRRKLAFAEATKDVLAMTAKEASALRHKRIRPEHVLLALTCPKLRTPSLLEALDVSPWELRERTLAALRRRAAA